MAGEHDERSELKAQSDHASDAREHEIPAGQAASEISSQPDVESDAAGPNEGQTAAEAPAATDGEHDERSEIKAQSIHASDAPEQKIPASEAASEMSSEGDLASNAQAPSESQSAAEAAPAQAASSHLRLAADKKSRASLWPIAAGIVVGAGLAVGGAFALRAFDGSKTASLELYERISALSARLDSVEKKLDATAAAERSALTGVEGRIGAVEGQARKTAADASSALRDLQESFTTRLAGLVKTPGGGSEEFTDLGPLQARIDALDKKIASVDEEVAAAKTESHAQQEPQDVAALIEQGSHAQAVAIVAESLVRKLEWGVPFPSEFAALEKLGVGRNELATLQPFAEKGVDSPRKLAEQFSSVASAIAMVDEKAEEDAGLLDRLTREASHLVRIRRVGDVDANEADASAQVARIESALARLDVEEAFSIWSALPSEAKAKSESWGKTVKARIDALNAARSLEADAMAALGKPKS